MKIQTISMFASLSALISLIFIIVLEHRYVGLRELNKYNGTTISVGTRLQLRGLIVLILLFAFLASVIIAIKYPMVRAISDEIAFGELYVFLFFCFNLGFLYRAVLTRGYAGAASIIGYWATALETVWLFKLSPKARDVYNLHGRWRWAILHRRLIQLFDQPIRLNAHFVRVFFVLVGTTATVWAAKYLVSDLEFGEGGSITVKQVVAHPHSITALIFFLSAPVAFVLWFFRDQNNLWQIENSRKDVNLKDFQKLAEWAAGLHLPEDKFVRSDKSSTSRKTVGDSSKIEFVELSESTQNFEKFAQDTSGVLRSHSRRDGAIALQVAAIYQLRAFLRGDFGSHFKRPAFQLLKSVWMALIQQNINELENFRGTDRSSFISFTESWRVSAYAATSQGVGDALSIAMTSDSGRLLRNHQKDLPGITLAGWCGILPGQKIRFPNVVLDELDLQRSNLQGINLKEAYLAKVNLSNAKLFGAEFDYAHMQAADLRFCDAKFARFNGARLQGAKLDYAVLFGADMYFANLQDAVLDGASLGSASLDHAQLQGARLLNITFNAETSCAGTKFNSKTIIAVAAIKAGIYKSDYVFPEDYDIDELATRRLVEMFISRGAEFTGD